MSSPFVTNFPGSLDDAVSLPPAKNNAAGILAAPGLAIGAPSFSMTSLADADEFGTVTPVTIDDEILYCSRSGVVFTVLARGQEGTSEANHAAGVDVEQNFNAGWINAAYDAIKAVQTELQNSLIAVVWGMPGAESGNAIEIPASCLGFAGQAFVSGLVDVRIIVTDAANDAEPSHTATIGPASIGVGTILSGSGTATVTVRTDSNGAFKIKVSEPSAGNRYLWISAGGHSRLWVRSTVGVVNLAFS